MCNYSPLPCYFLVPRPHFSARPMRFGSCGPSDLCLSRPYVSDTSPKSIDREGLERRRGGTWQTIIHLIYPPPPPLHCVVVNFPWDYCNIQEKLKAMVMKSVGGGGGKQGARIMGSVKMVNLVPLIKKIWRLICFVVYQIYADTLWSRGHH